MKALKPLILSALVLTLTQAAEAEATYFRFWRGVPNPGLSAREIETDLNSSLLPATGRLADSEARLESYQPVLVSPALAAIPGFPHEMALISYESEESYRAYRSTPEGKAYGDLHWISFDKQFSRSLVPEPYAGAPAIEHAYDAVGGEADWNEGVSTFRVYLRDPAFSEAEYLEAVGAHVDFMRSARPRGLMILVARDYVMEYSLWASEEHKSAISGTILESMDPEQGVVSEILDPLVETAGRLAMEAELPVGGVIRYGTGVRYPLTR